MDLPVVRPARVEDAPAMAEVHVAAWQVGYRGLLPDAFLDDLTVTRSTEVWTTIFAGEQPEGWKALVAEVDQRLLGICSLGPYRPVDDQETPAELCELWMLNVHPEAWGRGVAQALMAAALDGLRTGRPEPVAALWVLEHNARGRRFYEKEEWSADGAEKRETFLGQEATEVRYRRPL